MVVAGGLLRDRGRADFSLSKEKIFHLIQTVCTCSLPDFYLLNLNEAEQGFIYIYLPPYLPSDLPSDLGLRFRSFSVTVALCLGGLMHL